ncbi:MAG: rdgB [Chloroflexi bacterium]|nr:rdgB [Chloroflexota bacterium]
MTQIFLATTNSAKLDRLRWLVDGLGLSTVTQSDLEIHVAPHIAEDGADFTENAKQKAVAWSRAAGNRLTLATDGGLEIPALGRSWDALRTRRNAGPESDGTEKIAHLLRLMRSLKGEARNSLWHEAIALAKDGSVLETWSDSGDGGKIVETYVPGASDTTAFWTECIRYYPAVGKLYRDLLPAQLEALDTVWPRLREQVQRYLRHYAATEGSSGI